MELTGPLAGKPLGAGLWQIASTSSQAWRRSDSIVIDTETVGDLRVPRGEKGAFALGYAYEGTLASAFAPGGPSKKPVRLVVIGDSDFARDEYVRLARLPALRAYSAGADLVLQAIDWSCGDGVLAPLRAQPAAAGGARSP